MKKYYITTAIDYVNSLPHIGTAYEKITADCIARAMRLLGYDVRFCMGTDEHSINVKKKAIEEGLSPKDYCDRMVPQFEKIWENLSISYDSFIRTTEERHIIAVTELFNRIKAAGDIFTADYKGWYCEGCEYFIQEKDLIDGKCPNHMTKPAWIDETNYFFRLSKFEKPLLDHIRNNPDFIRPASRRNEIVKLIEGGLENISVSRSGFDWGIPLPEDREHVVYVWFDALINYISALNFGGNDTTLFEKYWPADLHIIGKDITRFHCVIWPAMLMSAGVQLPRSIFGHGFIYHRGEKMSKSLGNVVSPLDIVEEYGADPLRYFLLREVVYGQDGDFTYDRFEERYKSDLANDLGNLLSRTVSMIERYLGGVIPESAVLPVDAVSHSFPDVLKRWTAAIERHELSIACESVWYLVRAANKRVEESAPWKIARDSLKKDELVSVLYDLVSAIGGIAILLQPFMPTKSAVIWKSLKYPGNLTDVKLNEHSTIPLVPRGVPIEKILPIFPIFVKVTEEIKVTDSPKLTVSPPEAENEIKEEITIDDFARLDIRIGTILNAENVDGSTKLLRLDIEDGMGKRRILAGLAQYFSPEELIGKQVAFIANLKPRKMMDEYSHGMVLAAEDNGKFTILTPDIEVSPGSKVS